jgi:hypothetical protein
MVDQRGSQYVHQVRFRAKLSATMFFVAAGFLASAASAQPSSR